MEDQPVTRPAAGRPPSSRRARLNFTALQFILFAGAGLVGLAALLATGLAFGLALAGAAMIAVVALVVWFIAANFMSDMGSNRRRPPAP